MSKTTASLNILAIGASRNIGYYAVLKLLSKIHQGATVTFLLRNPSIFDNYEDIQPFLSSGKARTVKGDALVKNDISRTWSESTRDSTPVDYLLFTLAINVAVERNCIGQSQRLYACNAQRPLHHPPEIILHQEFSLSRRQALHLTHILAFHSHSNLYTAVPSLGHTLTNWGMERILHYVTEGWIWDSAKNGDPSTDILPSNWLSAEGLPAEGSLKSMVVVRPSLLVDGKSQAEKFEAKGRKDKEPYKVSLKEIGGYTVSRKDVADFVVDAVTKRWAEFENKVVNISY